jgi:hypothetical protein
VLRSIRTSTNQRDRDKPIAAASIILAFRGRRTPPQILATRNFRKITKNIFDWRHAF